MTPADPGTPDWLREAAFKPYTDNEEFVPLSKALAALEAREQQVIDRAVELLRGDGPREYLGPPVALWTEDMRRYYLTGMYEAADFLERELRPEDR